MLRTDDEPDRPAGDGWRRFAMMVGMRIHVVCLAVVVGCNPPAALDATVGGDAGPRPSDPDSGAFDASSPDAAPTDAAAGDATAPGDAGDGGSDAGFDAGTPGFASPDIYEWSFEGDTDLEASGRLFDGSATGFFVTYPDWTRDRAFAHSGVQSAMLTQPPGLNDHGGALYYDLVSRYDRIFVRYYLRLSPGFSTNDNSKVFRIYRDTIPLGAAVHSFVKGQLNAWRALWDRYNPVSLVGSGSTPSDALGTWTYLEFEVDTRATPGVGVARVWAVDADNLLYESTQAIPDSVHDLRLIHLFGISDSLNATTTEYVWVDDLAISTRRIGP